MPFLLKERNISTEHNRLKYPYWREADQYLASYKHDGAVVLGYIRNFGLVVRAGLEPATFRF